MQKLFYIDYPQESFEGQPHRYRCQFCQEETTKINGRLEGHLESCEYRRRLEASGFEVLDSISNPVLKESDDFD